MDRIFQRAKDKNVAVVVVYAKASENANKKAYKDAECTVQYTGPELLDAFYQGAVIVKGSAIYAPAGFNGGKITYVDTVSSALAFVELAGATVV